MHILIINTGSASTKLTAYEVSGDRSRPLHSEHYGAGEASPQALLEQFLAAHDMQVDAVCHRVVHGGSRLTGACLIDEDVEGEIERLAALAPLHNPVALSWIKASRSVFRRDPPHVAVFDTAFYTRLPPRARTYALPGALAQAYEIRRYGFHGIAHRAMWQRWCRLRPDLPDGGRLISLQLGGGCSMTATRDGTPLDTSMGFSPVEGLVMASRSGDLDPSVVTYLMREKGLSHQDVDRLLNEASGLKGVSGNSADMAVVLEDDAPASRAAVDLYCYRIRKYLGAYLAALGGADGIIFGGGVGEHAPLIRARALAGMEWCGIALDSHANEATVGREGRISQPASGIEAWVTPVDEAAVLAQEAYNVLKEAP